MQQNEIEMWSYGEIKSISKAKCVNIYPHIPTTVSDHQRDSPSIIN